MYVMVQDDAGIMYAVNRLVAKNYDKVLINKETGDLVQTHRAIDIHKMDVTIRELGLPANTEWEKV